MSGCPHTFWEREGAVAADGLCPLCQDAEIERLLRVCKDKTALLKDAYAQADRLKTDLKEQRDLYRHDCAKLMDEIERLRAERDFWQRAHVAALAPTEVP
jgi:hypothetical protein